MENSETLLALVHPGIALLIGMLLMVATRVDSRQNYFTSFAGAFMLYGGGILLQTLLVPRNLSANITLSGLLYLSSALFFCRGLLLLGERPVPWRLLGTIFGLAVGLRAYFTFAEWNGIARAALLQLCIMLMMGVTWWRVRHLRTGLSYEQLLFWLVLGLVASFGLRTLLLAGRGALQYGYDGTLYWLAVQTTFYVFNLLIALVLFLVSASRAVHAIRQSSYLDPLTGINNRKGFHMRMSDNLAGCDRYGLIALDIDFFKSINDRHGHIAGDKVLVMLGKMLEQQLRPGDVVARYGGEEFLVFLPQADAAATHLIAERLRRAIETLDLSAVGRDLSCTASVGAGSFPADTTLEQAYRKVDALLYQGKAAGRNQTWGAAGRISR